MKLEQFCEIEKRASGEDPTAYHDVRQCQADRAALLSFLKEVLKTCEQSAVQYHELNGKYRTALRSAQRWDGLASAVRELDNRTEGPSLIADGDVEDVLHRILRRVAKEDKGRRATLAETAASTHTAHPGANGVEG